MGIRGLWPAVHRYGMFSSLTGDTVVIDGPALVHQILDGCMSQRPTTNGFICHPSYSTLGSMVIEWLEELRRHNVTIRKIYFDGYLPPSKWQVRRERLLYQSKTMKDLVTSHPAGSSKLPENAFEALRGAISLTQTIGNSSHSRWLPKPPFLVPAVIEILKSYQIWGPLIEVVSGEADMFCAEDVRQHGGIILTGDSDLLITDLGPDGKVSFFSDIVAADRSGKSPGLVACKFSLHAINDLLGLNSVGGLPRVAFEKQKWRVSFAQALERARNSNGNGLESPEFQDFLQEYSFNEHLPKEHPVQSMLTSLDPRISEIIIQTLVLDGNGTVPNAGTPENSRGPETLAMFLPIMIENRDRKSAWTMSTAVRQLAYGIMQEFSLHKSLNVIEYRLLEASNSLMGRQIDVLESEEALEQCRLLAEIFKQLTERIHCTDMKWLAFAICQDTVWSASEQRSPLSVSLLSKAKKQAYDSDEYSWDTIHFTAQVQASLYSLRMAKQALDVAASLCQTLPAPMRQLREWFDTLPTIVEWPTVDNISKKLATADESNILTVITDILGVPALIDPETSAKTTKPKKRKGKHGLLRSERDPKRPTSVNSFAILSSAALG